MEFTEVILDNVSKLGVILVGVKNSDSKFHNHAELYSIWADLYMMWKWWSKIGCDYTIITDLTENPPDNIFNKLFNEGNFDIKFKTFITDQKNKIKPLSDIITVLRDYKFKYSRVCLYYSGHGLNGNIYIPQAISIIEIFSILDPVNKDFKGMIILDCCHGDNLFLPYCYDEKEKKFLLEEDRKTKEILESKSNWMILAASSSEALSFCSAFGSKFTIDLIKKFEQKIRHFKEFSKLGPIRSNKLPITNLLWSWIFGISEIEIKFSNGVIDFEVK